MKSKLYQYSWLMSAVEWPLISGLIHCIIWDELSAMAILKDETWATIPPRPFSYRVLVHKAPARRSSSSFRIIQIMQPGFANEGRSISTISPTNLCVFDWVHILESYPDLPSTAISYQVLNYASGHWPLIWVQPGVLDLDTMSAVSIGP
ncbi:hypothetical protein VNO77_34668 [Canavalia gladiata]|uniref:Uncharacterized protein n=1 Tax=Canavalia gladiata TaxID=3824 RepID=A0AAN9Q1Y8_CANGL